MPKTFTNEDGLDAEVLFVMNMHRGKENAIGRWDLVRRIFGEDAVPTDQENDTNFYDRQVRESLERLRATGQHLCNVGNGRGYYVAADREEYEEFKRYYLGAAIRKFEVTRMMDEMADQRFGKVEKAAPVGQMSLI